MTPTEPKQEPKKRFRMSWKDFNSYLNMWNKNQKLHPGYAAFTSFQESSNIYTSFDSEESMVRSRTLCPEAKVDGVEKSIESLTFPKRYARCDDR